MPTEPLIKRNIQLQLGKHINDIAHRVCGNFEQHADERNLMGAFNQALSDAPASLDGAEVRFKFRNFPDQTEEKKTGADGGYIVKVDTPNGRTEKAEIYQAKRIVCEKITRDLRLRSEEAERLHRQARDMCKESHGAAIIVITKKGIRAIDAQQIAEARDRRNPFRDVRIVSIGTFLGVWLARCTRGQTDPDFVDKVKNRPGFLASYLHMHVVVK